MLIYISSSKIDNIIKEYEMEQRRIDKIGIDEIELHNLGLVVKLNHQNLFQRSISILKRTNSYFEFLPSNPELNCYFKICGQLSYIGIESNEMWIEKEKRNIEQKEFTKDEILLFDLKLEEHSRFEIAKIRCRVQNILCFTENTGCYRTNSLDPGILQNIIKVEVLLCVFSYNEQNKSVHGSPLYIKTIKEQI